jgi:hypothetical protein
VLERTAYSSTQTKLEEMYSTRLPTGAVELGIQEGEQ